MSPAEALARRAVAAPGWRWLPGTVTACGWRVLRASTLRDTECVIAAHDDDDTFQWWRNSTGWHCSRMADEPQPESELTDYPAPPKWLPDLTDAATLGAVESLAPWAYLSPVLELGTPNRIVGWVAYLVADDSRISRHDTRADAAVAALEAAPRSPS